MADRNWIYRTVMFVVGLVLAALAPTASHAGGRHNNEVFGIREHRFSAGRAIGHYVMTHKFPLIIDSVVVLANAADAASTLHAAHNCPTCIDYALGPNPSATKTWGTLMSFSAGLVAFNHLAYHHYREDGTDPSWVGQKFFVLAFSIPVVVHAAADVNQNAQIQPSSANLARQRLIGAEVLR